MRWQAAFLLASRAGDRHDADSTVNIGRHRPLNFFRRHAWLALLLALGLVRADAQEALRQSLAGDVAAAGRQQAQSTVGYYNLLWGPVSLRFNAAASAEYTDNSRSSASHQSSDEIFRPSVGADLNWPVTEWNTLNVSLAAGYSFYAQNSDLNQFYLNPGSGISFEMFVGDWVLNFHDRASVSENTYENPTYNGRSSNAQMQNDAGVSGRWDLNKIVLNTGFDHVNYTSLDGGRGQPDSSSENFSLNLAYKVLPELLVGVEGGLGLISYAAAGATNTVAVRDATQWSGGVFSSWQASEHLSMRLDAGYTVYSPGQTGTNLFLVGTNIVALPVGGDYTALYFQFSVSHTVNEHVSYTLSAGHSVDFAYNGSPTDRYFVALNPRWNFIRNFSVSPSFRWESGSQLATGATSYDQYGVGLTVGCSLTQKLSASAYYQWVMETANQAALNYTANIVGLNLAYRF